MAGVVGKPKLRYLDESQLIQASYYFTLKASLNPLSAESSKRRNPHPHHSALPATSTIASTSTGLLRFRIQWFYKTRQHNIREGIVQQHCRRFFAPHSGDKSVISHEICSP